MSTNFLFRGLDDAQLTRIMEAMIRLEVPKGKEVIKQGDKGDLFYVAERGEFEVFIGEASRPAKEGKLIHTYVASAEEGKHPCFGELALMYAKPRQASVVASTDGVLWGLNRVNFRKASAGRDMLKVRAPPSPGATPGANPEPNPIPSAKPDPNPTPTATRVHPAAPRCCVRSRSSRRCGSISCRSCATR